MSLLRGCVQRLNLRLFVLSAEHSREKERQHYQEEHHSDCNDEVEHGVLNLCRDYNEAKRQGNEVEYHGCLTQFHEFDAQLPSRYMGRREPVFQGEEHQKDRNHLGEQTCGIHIDSHGRSLYPHTDTGLAE